MLEAYHEASSKTSEIARQLAFAGIAVIWVLKVGTDSGGVPFSVKLIVPLYCFSVALAADLGQYIYKTAAWWALNQYHWRKHKDNIVDVDVSSLVNFPTHILFWGKIVVVVYGYACLLFFIKSWL